MEAAFDMTYKGTIGSWVVMMDAGGTYWGLSMAGGYDPVKAASFSMLAEKIRQQEALRDINKQLYSQESEHV